MDTVPQRSTMAVALSFLLVFAGGIGLGVLLARLFAAGSWLAEGVSGFLFPLVLAFGLQAWLGFAVLFLLPRLAIRMIRGRLRRPERPADGRVPAVPGSVVFLPLGAFLGLVSGAVVGFLSPTHSVVVVAPIYFLAGAAYGALVWRLARSGYLQSPQAS